MLEVPHNLKILLVEDDRTMRQIEISTLKKIGYNNVVQASNGNEAIEILQQELDIHLIISDWNMPQKGGFELLTWVRANNQFRNIPFIMATGQADKIHEQKAFDAGVTGFLVKPFADEELKSTLNMVFGINKEEFSEIKSIPRVNEHGKIRLRIAHIQITDHLVLGVLKHLLDRGELKANHFELEPICMLGWNPVAKSLEQGVVDGACILAPLGMDLYSVGTPIKLVLLSHKNGSVFVRKNINQSQIEKEHHLQKENHLQKDKDDKDDKNNDTSFYEFFKNSSFLIPHKMSVHHMLSHLVLNKTGLKPSMSKGVEFNVEFEVAPPINMPEFIKTNIRHSGFMVAEPIGSQAADSGVALRQFLSGELWENHPCCAVVMQKEFIDTYTDATFEFTRLLVKAGKYIAMNPDHAAQIAVRFLDSDESLGLSISVLKKVLTEPKGIITDDLYPVVADLDTMQHYMVKEMGIGSIINVDEFVDLRFADNSCDMGLADYKPSVLHSSDEEILRILNQPLSVLKEENEPHKLELSDKSKPTTVPKIKHDTMNTNSENENRNIDIQANVNVDKGEVIAEEGKYLTFFLDKEEYGVTIRHIREIIGMMPITHVPRTPCYVKGVINLRGKVIPVMELSVKFGMKPVDYTDKTCILVVEVPSGRDGHSVQIGVIVDSVSEVISIRKEDIEKNPKFSSSIDTDSIIGMAKVGDRVIILLDIDKSLSIYESRE